jgi:hypothetical protein
VRDGTDADLASQGAAPAAREITGNGSSGPEVLEEEAHHEGGQTQAGPLGLAEDAVVAGGGAMRQVLDDAQQVGNGASAGGEDAQATTSSCTRGKVAGVKAGAKRASRDRASWLYCP